MSGNSELSKVSQLEQAVCVGTVDEVSKLVDAGADVNFRGEDGFTPLMLAAARGHEATVNYLLAKGARVNDRNDLGQTSLMITAKGGFHRLLARLAATGADVNAVDYCHMNATHWAVSHGDFPETIAALVVLGADLNRRNQEGYTPLMYAAMLGFPKSAGVLVIFGADETIDVNGQTALDMAKLRKHPEVVDAIDNALKNRANLADDSAQT